MRLIPISSLLTIYLLQKVGIFFSYKYKLSLNIALERFSILILTELAGLFMQCK